MLVEKLLEKFRFKVNSYIIEGAYKLFFSKKSEPAAQKKLLIVKPDAIGDYVICRNILREFRYSEKFAAWEVLLLTKASVIPIITELDSGLFNSLIPLPYKTYSPLERLRFVRQLRKMGFSCVLHPLYSPNKFTYEIVRFINAKASIGIGALTLSITSEEKKMYEKYFTSVIEVGTMLHEFSLQKQFFQKVIGGGIRVTSPYIAMEFKRKKKLVVICPGAQSKYRIWSPENFASVASALHDKNQDINFLIVTGPGEDGLGEAVRKNLSFNVQHIHNPSFNELFRLFGESLLVLGNDSAPIHIASALKTPAICVSNGNHYRRFVPYTEDMPSSIEVVVPAKLQEKVSLQSNSYYFGSTEDINEIDYLQVVDMCKRYLHPDEQGLKVSGGNYAE